MTTNLSFAFFSHFPFQVAAWEQNKKSMQILWFVWFKNVTLTKQYYTAKLLRMQYCIMRLKYKLSQIWYQIAEIIKSKS